MMIAANFTEFRFMLKKYLDAVADHHAALIRKRNPGKGAVMISPDEQNSIMETVQRLSSKANTDRFYEYILHVKNSQTVIHDIVQG